MPRATWPQTEETSRTSETPETSDCRMEGHRTCDARCSGTRSKIQEGLQMALKDNSGLVAPGVCGLIAIAATLGPTAFRAFAAQSPQTTSRARPNILVIFGDDVGQSNISAYTHGLVGYRTPHIDRIAREGMLFTDYYA